MKIGYTRDGWYFTRPDRRQWLPYSETVGAWNYGNVQSAAGGPLYMGDTLYFHCSGRNATQSVTGLATIRRDGFTSVDAGSTAGDLTTRVVSFQGSRLFVNVQDPNGSLQVEVQNSSGTPISGFTLANCDPIKADSTIYPVTWGGSGNLASLAGQQVRFRFHLTSGSLYSFWVAPDANGASNGYIGAGGPGYPANKDTTGKAAYAAAYFLNQVDAGSDATVSQAAGASLSGTISTAGVPSGRTFTPTWSVTSGPGNVTFDNPNAAATPAHFSAPGKYILRLTINDMWITAWDEVTINVSSAPLAPVVTMPANVTTAMPAAANPGAVALNATVSDDGQVNPVVMTWSVLSAPTNGVVTFTNTNAASTTANFNRIGAYTLQLDANDGAQHSTGTMTVTVQEDPRADFDKNGAVDGLDFLAWQRNYNHGTAASGAPILDANFNDPNYAKANGDANGDGKVDGQDYLIWQQDYVYGH